MSKLQCMHVEKCTDPCIHADPHDFLDGMFGCDQDMYCHHSEEFDFPRCRAVKDE